MAKKLGKVKKPSAKKFEKGRKLFFLPLIFSPEKPEPEFTEMLEKYWQQAQEQLDNLEGKLSRVNKVFHELVADRGGGGIKEMEEMDTGSKKIVKKCLDKGAEFHPVEERYLLSEFIDWSRCLSIGLLSSRALEQVEKCYDEVQKKRWGKITEVIDETLKGDDVGLLAMRDDQQVQFPSDIQVFYISPPTLDEIKKWLRENGYLI